MKIFYLFIALLLSCCSVQKFVVENETVTTAYWMPADCKDCFVPVEDTILQVRDMKGKRRLLYGFPPFSFDYSPLELKLGDTISFDVRHNYLKAVWVEHAFIDECHRWRSAWLEPSYPPVLNPKSCKCQ